MFLELKNFLCGKSRTFGQCLRGFVKSAAGKKGTLVEASPGKRVYSNGVTIQYTNTPKGKLKYSILTIEKPNGEIYTARRTTDFHGFSRKEDLFPNGMTICVM